MRKRNSRKGVYIPIAATFQIQPTAQMTVQIYNHGPDILLAKVRKEVLTIEPVLPTKRRRKKRGLKRK